MSFRDVLEGITVTIVGGILLAVIIQDARFAPQGGQDSATPLTSSSETDTFSTSEETIQTPSPTLIQTPKPEPTISGEWEGEYVCSERITGVTVAISQTGNTVIADFFLYPPPENLGVPYGVERYEGRSGSARYEGNFNPTSRLISFSRGEWREQPSLFWTAFGFYGEFDENLETFSGRMDHHSCTTINLRRKDN